MTLRRTTHSAPDDRIFEVVSFPRVSIIHGDSEAILLQQSVTPLVVTPMSLISRLCLKPDPEDSGV